MNRWNSLALLAVAWTLSAACGGSGDADSGGASGRRGGGPPSFGGGPAAAVPVEVATVERRTVSSFLETHSTLEAENEVDLVARLSGPIVQLAAEEGMRVSRGQLLARIDPDEARAQREIALVDKNESQLIYQRLRRLYDEGLVSQEQLEQARARAESTAAQLQGREIQLDWAEVRAPFAGLIVRRYVKQAETVSVNTPLFRLSDFDPLLCPIQVPERELGRLEPGQRARLEVEAFPDETFEARVLRISPIVDADSGTVEVTLEASGRSKLRPGMFASVFLETESRADALVIPFSALALDRLGDSVYVVENDQAMRREIELGFREGDAVEVRSGLAEDEVVVAVGQDGLSDGTPVEIVEAGGEVRRPAAGRPPGGEAAGAVGEARPFRAGGPTGGEGPSPEQIEAIKERMRQRGLSEEQIEERLKRTGERRQGGGGQ
ncbi:MAG: efflux RND transporter periplasmic adaptor subunit [Acidobacteriota bacterium]